MKRFLALFLAICLCFGCVPATHAHATEVEADPQAENSWRYENGELIEEVIPEAAEDDVTVGEDGSLGDIEDVEENPDLYTFYPSESKALGIDVSEHQGQINWDKVAAAGIKFAIIRCGYGQNQTNQDDDWFTYNISECNRVGIPFGLYLYSYAKTVSAAQGEADHAIRLINVAKQYKNFSLPMYYDLEENSQFAMGASAVYNMAKAFHDRVEASTSWPVGIYANTNWFNNVLTYDWYQDQPLWCAQYNSYCQYNGDYDIWQYSSSGSVNGISGRVDMNYSRVPVSSIGSGTSGGVTNTATVVTDKNTYKVGEAIMVTANSTASDAWVGIYPKAGSEKSLYWYNVSDYAGEPVNVLNRYTYINNAWTKITCNWNATYMNDEGSSESDAFWGSLKAGTYTVGVYTGNGGTPLASKEITISGSISSSSISVEKSFYPTNQSEHIYVTATSPNHNAWVGLYKKNVTPGTADSYVWYNVYGRNNEPVDICWDYYEYNPASTSNYTWPLEAGEYKVVLFKDSGYTVDKTAYFTVGVPALTTDKSTYCVNQDIYVSSNYCSENGWVGLYESNVSYGENGKVAMYWYWLSNGELTYTENTNIFGFQRGRPEDYKAGTYNIIMFQDSGYTEIARKTITVVNCTDSNKNHECDYCGTSMGTHAAASGSHNCSYCGQAVSSCNANNSTVAAKYLKTAATCQSAAVYYKSCSVCGNFSTSNATFTNGGVDTNNHVSGCTLTWSQTATQHTQKYSECGTVKVAATNHTWNNGTCSVCGYVCNLTTDTDKNHNCDTCGKVVSTCSDGDKDHNCDTCGTGNQGTHAPATGSHICDYCKQKASECVDTNPVDGKCDVCGVSVSHTCVDEDTNHACDICSEPMGTHTPAEGSHNCAYCGEAADTGCKDAEPRDHECDICGADCGDPHAAAEGSHNCAYCGGKVTNCDDKTGDGNHSCDVCGAADVTKCADGNDADHDCDECHKEDVSQCADGNNDHNCDQCQETLTTCTDGNGDNECDICGATVSKTTLNIAKTTVEVGEGLLVTATSNVAGDWVGIYDKGVVPADGENAAYYWYYVEGTDSTSGKSWTNGNTYNIFTGVGDDNHKDLKGLPAGNYDVVLLASDYTEKNRVSVTIQAVAEGEKPAPSLTVSKSVYAYGEEVRYTATSYKTNPWIGLYAGTLTAESQIPTSMSWQYVQGRNGTEDTWGPQNPGDYTIILFDDYSNYTVDKFVHFTVEETDAPALTTDKDEYEIGEPIMVTTNYIGGSAWVGLYQADDTYGDGETNDAAIFWYYLIEEGNPTNILETRDENERGDDYGIGEFKIILFSSDYNEVTTKTITVKEAHTCEDKNPLDHNCDICGKNGISAHTFDKKTNEHKASDATCQSPATYYFTCACGEVGSTTYTDGSVNGENHTGNLTWDKDEDSHKQYYSCCQEVKVAEGAHTWNDGVCSVCQYACSSHVDENEADHNCDICGKKLGNCKDENPADGECDICGAPINHTCSDKTGDNNHNCDICGEPMADSVCSDAENDGDHDCDECHEPMEDAECADEAGDRDHKCDECFKPGVTQCADKEDDGDHDCDECGKPMEGAECVDDPKDGDHRCDECDRGSVTTCADKEDDGDHECDDCGKTMKDAQCSDTENDGDHDCDECHEPMEDAECADKDNDRDHKCDECFKADITQCADKEDDGDHDCDECGKAMKDAQCSDADGDNECDECSDTICEHKDENKDHNCDTCKKPVSEHKDENKDHNCDVCGQKLSDCKDEDKNGKCDICEGDVEPEPTEPEETEPKPTEPEETEPKPTEPEETEPKPTEPEAEEDVIRLAGEDRFDTAFIVADKMKEELGVEKFNTIIVASGKDFADALSGSYLAAVKNAPILLSYKDEQNKQVVDYIRENLAEGGTVYILGGPKAVPESMEKTLSDLKVERLAGENRFDTNTEILKEVGVPADETILVCTGSDFADCLSGSAVGKPIMLVYKKLMDSQKEYLPTLDNNFCIIGGENAVNKNIAITLEQFGEVERLAGAHRYETSVLVAEKFFQDPDSAVLAYAKNYPDGLCGGALAVTKNAPLLLTDSKYFSYAAEYAEKNGIAFGIVLGGDKLISDKAVESIFGE